MTWSDNSDKNLSSRATRDGLYPSIKGIKPWTDVCSALSSHQTESEEGRSCPCKVTFHLHQNTSGLNEVSDYTLKCFLFFSNRVKLNHEGTCGPRTFLRWVNFSFDRNTNWVNKCLSSTKSGVFYPQLPMPTSCGRSPKPTWIWWEMLSGTTLPKRPKLLRTRWLRSDSLSSDRNWSKSDEEA